MALHRVIFKRFEHILSYAKEVQDDAAYDLSSSETILDELVAFVENVCLMND